MEDADPKIGNSSNALRTWLAGLDNAGRDEMTNAIYDWLDEEVDASEYGYTAMAGFSGQASALCFFQSEPELVEALDIKIIEGDHPGSSYFAAEISQDIESTNALAAAEGLPIRFAASN